MQSMTGFGKGDATLGTQTISIEIKSVNHRYLDTRFRLPFTLSFLELSLLEILKSHFERGSFEINIKQKSLSSTENGHKNSGFGIDEEAAKSLIEAVEKLHLKFGTPKNPSLEFLLQSGRVFIPQENPENLPELTAGVKKTFERVLKDLKMMREQEGMKLKTILLQGVSDLVKATSQLSQLAPRQPEKIKERLESRLAKWELSTPMDPHRLEWEIALAAEKADITEEIDRLKTHAEAFTGILNQAGPVGRKLDFLTQELHREVNTTASKSADIEITQVAVGLKTQIEKLREQVQNVE